MYVIKTLELSVYLYVPFSYFLRPLQSPSSDLLYSSFAWDYGYVPGSLHRPGQAFEKKNASFPYCSSLLFLTPREEQTVQQLGLIVAVNIAWAWFNTTSEHFKDSWSSTKLLCLATIWFKFRVFLLLDSLIYQD